MKFGHLLTLRRFDGAIYLDRWGLSTRWFGVYIHRMNAPDPGWDLHDHPWSFVSLVLRGGYVEERVGTDVAALCAGIADRFPTTCHRGGEERRMAGTIRALRTGECHRVVELLAPTVWSLVLRGPTRRDRADERSPWGFYLAEGWMDEKTYDETVRAERRDLSNEVGS